MVTMDTYFSLDYEIWATDFVKVQDCTKEDNIPFQDRSFADIVGAIVLVADGQVIIDTEWYDDIVSLWKSIASKFGRICLRETVVINAPDMPSRLTFVPGENNRVAMSLDGELRGDADKDELLRAISEEGRAFFNKMIELVPEEKERYLMYLDCLKKITWKEAGSSDQD